MHVEVVIHEPYADNRSVAVLVWAYLIDILLKVPKSQHHIFSMMENHYMDDVELQLYSNIFSRSSKLLKRQEIKYVHYWPSLKASEERFFFTICLSGCFVYYYAFIIYIFMITENQCSMFLVFILLPYYTGCPGGNGAIKAFIFNQKKKLGF